MEVSKYLLDYPAALLKCIGSSEVQRLSAVEVGRPSPLF
jgi:hypothetical protein